MNKNLKIRAYFILQSILKTTRVNKWQMIADNQDRWECRRTGIAASPRGERHQTQDEGGGSL